MAKDDEIKGEGNSYNFNARFLDSRIARWFATPAVTQLALVCDEWRIE